MGGAEGTQAPGDADKLLSVSGPLRIPKSDVISPNPTNAQTVSANLCRVFSLENGRLAMKLSWATNNLYLGTQVMGSNPGIRSRSYGESPQLSKVT